MSGEYPRPLLATPGQGVSRHDEPELPKPTPPPPSADESSDLVDEAHKNSPNPSVWRLGQMGIQHLEILFLSHGNQRHCRSCLYVILVEVLLRASLRRNTTIHRLRQVKDPNLVPLVFAPDTTAEVLFTHCETEHPVACEKLADKLPQELDEIRKQVETTDWQLLNTVEESENDKDGGICG
jgi:hypothetical protein